MTHHIAETVRFTLVPGVSPEQFVSLSKASEAFVRASQGFVFRRLSSGSDGHWTDTVIWADMTAAKAAAENFPKQDFAPALMAAIAPDSVTMRHETIHWTMFPT